jgi:hypothetical protein
VNRETNYNKLFGRNPVVGVATPLAGGGLAMSPTAPSSDDMTVPTGVLPVPLPLRHPAGASTADLLGDAAAATATAATTTALLPTGSGLRAAAALHASASATASARSSISGLAQPADNGTDGGALAANTRNRTSGLRAGSAGAGNASAADTTASGSTSSGVDMSSSGAAMATTSLGGRLRGPVRPASASNRATGSTSPRTGAVAASTTPTVAAAGARFGASSSSRIQAATTSGRSANFTPKQ